MKKAGKKQFRQCVLEPIERNASRPIPGVPEHFNYGVFFDDGYDYMRYLKSASDFHEKAGYRITGIPENEVLEVEEPVPEEISREPEVDDPPVPEGLGLNSDSEEVDLASDLEDNFVELAGGPAVKDKESDDDAESGEEDALTANPPALKDVFPQNKVLMMERFLYGDNERDHDASGSSEAEDESIEDPDDATVLNRQFEKLLLRCKNRAGSASQSMMTGTSMMSEGLQYALSRDTRTLHHQHKKLDDVEVLDDEVRKKTMYRTKQLEEEIPPISSSEQSDEETSEPPPDIMSVQSDLSSTKPHFSYLAMPMNSGKSRASSRQPSMNDLTSNPESIDSVLRLDPSLLTRKKGESIEEKHLRKLAVKQHRRERRRVRKANQDNFRAEHERQLKTNVRMVTIS